MKFSESILVTATMSGFAQHKNLLDPPPSADEDFASYFIAKNVLNRRFENRSAGVNYLDALSSTFKIDMHHSPSSGGHCILKTCVTAGCGFQLAISKREKENVGFWW